MGRTLVLVVLTVVVAAAAGCGSKTPDAIKNAPAAKAVDIGNPGQYAMGVTPYKTTHFVVKDQVDGETRMWVVGSGVPGTTKPVQYDEAKKIFYEEGSFRKYDINGNALHKIADGPNKGQPAAPMDRFKISLDSKTGDLMFWESGRMKKDVRDNKDKGAYVVVP